MENDKSLFELQLDSFGKMQLKETAKWARFLAIAGFVVLGIALVFSILAAISDLSVESGYKANDDFNDAGYVAGYILGTLLMGALFVAPCFFLLRFSNKMNRALAADDIASLNDAFKNLKVTFRYAGILTIIFIALFALGLLGGIAGNV